MCVHVHMCLVCKGEWMHACVSMYVHVLVCESVSSTEILETVTK